MKDKPELEKALPEAYLRRMAELLQDEYPSFIQTYDQPPVTGLRVNTLKLSPEELKQKSCYELVPVSWCPSGFNVESTGKHGESIAPGKHPYHAAGL